MGQLVPGRSPPILKGSSGDQSAVVAAVPRKGNPSGSYAESMKIPSTPLCKWGTLSSSDQLLSGG